MNGGRMEEKQKNSSSFLSDDGDVRLEGVDLRPGHEQLF